MTTVIKWIILTLGAALLSFYIPKFVKYEKTPSAPRFFAVPSGKGAKFPRLSEHKNPRYMWWYESSELFISHFSEEGWTQPYLVKEPALSNWADGADITYFRDNYFAIIPTQNGLFLKSSEDGKLWQETPWQLPQSEKGEIGFAKFFALDGELFIAWLEGNDNGWSQLVYTRMNSDQKVILDEQVCECCSFSVLAEGSKVSFAYRDRLSDSTRPISIAVLDRFQKLTKSSFEQIMWKTQSCPINGPKLVKLEETYFLSWFDGSKGYGENYLAKSLDGINFENLGSMDNDLPSLGRLDLAALDDRILVSWIGVNEAEQGRLMARSYDPKRSEWSPVFELAGIHASRQSGFPQLTKWNDKLLVAWTSLGRDIIMAREFAYSFFKVKREQLPKAEVTLTKKAHDQLILRDSIGGSKSPILANKPNLLVFWATWCEPCIEEIPVMNQIKNRYPHLNLVSVVLDPSEKTSSFIHEHGIKYPVYEDPEGEAEQQFLVVSLPTTIFLDHSLGERWRIVGNEPVKLLRKIEEELQ